MRSLLIIALLFLAGCATAPKDNRDPGQMTNPPKGRFIRPY